MSTTTTARASRIFLAKAFVLFLSTTVYAEEADESAHRAQSLSKALGIENIVSATVIYSPNGFSDHKGRSTVFVNDPKTLGVLHKLLARFPALQCVTRF